MPWALRHCATVQPKLRPNQRENALGAEKPSSTDSRVAVWAGLARWRRAEHPMVRTHPATGRRALYVNRGFTTHIVGLSRDESAAILEMLYRHLERDDFKCRFKWQPRSIAFWDNRSTQHQAIWDYFPHRRYGHRLTICGDRPA